MKKSEEEVMREALRRKATLGGGVLVFLTLFVVTAAAAPAGKARANRTVLDPIASKPVWVSKTTTRSDLMLTEVMQQLRIADGNGNGPLVIVPPRPHPRSPFMPPSGTSLSDLPPWVQVGDP